jgi:DNA (cytosine-5)-methyltransferase 1
MEPLRVVSLFTGAGGFDLGLERAGMVTVAQCEWDQHCQRVLERHWPELPRWSDVREVNGADLPNFDVLAFGSPCQNLSIAGSRTGLDGEQSSLFFQAIRILKEYQNSGRHPAWVIWENVTGALTSGVPAGGDFARVLNEMASTGLLELQWAVLDAQHFGLPQRRARVFVVGRYFGNGYSTELFADKTGSNRNHATIQKTWSRTAEPHKTSNHQGRDTNRLNKLPVQIGTITTTFGSGNYSNVQEVNQGSVIPWVLNDTDCTLTVRRLMPIELERCQGWPDNWTQLGFDGQSLADNKRIALIGNGVAAPVAEWLGRQIINAHNELFQNNTATAGD